MAGNMVLLWQVRGCVAGPHLPFLVPAVHVCRCLALSACIMRVSACALTYPSTPRGDVAGSFELQDGLHRHWCNLSLFVEPLQFVQLPCEGACMRAASAFTLPAVGGRDTLCSCRLVIRVWVG